MSYRAIILAGLLLAGGGFWSPTLAAGPKVVSLDSCADPYVLALADPDQIVALSPSSVLPFSYYQMEAAYYPQHVGDVEGIWAVQPDVVIASAFSDFKVVGLLDQLGIPTTTMGLPNTLAEVKEELRRAGALLEKQDRAEQLISEMEAQLLTLNIEAVSGLRAVYMSPSGITTGPNTFLGEVLALAGLQNAMDDAGLAGWGQIDLEAIVQDPPDVVIGSFFDARLGSADTWRFAEHPAMQAVLDQAVFIEVPSRLLACPAWYVLEAVADIQNRLPRNNHAD